jgi:ABC-type sugar transport system substrate-binding protein
MKRLSYMSLAFLMSLGCAGGDREKPITIGVDFETLQTEYWVASFSAIKAELAKRDFKMVEAIADGDPNRQLEQVNNFITRKVNGIIVVPKDAGSIVPMIKAANRASIPIVLYNRPPAKNEGKCVTVVADNFKITYDTVRCMAELARKSGKPCRAMILIGDLGDINAVDRRNGFDAAVKESNGAITVVARVPTEWNQEKALAGVTNALQANPDIDFIFSSSDFLLPSLVSALKTAGKYKKINEAGHVILGSFDGDATAYGMLVDGYLDADGVQDTEFECAAAVDAISKLRANEPVEDIIRDPGFVINQDNQTTAQARMWGARIAK